MKTFQYNETQTEKYMGQTISGFDFYLNLVGTNTALPLLLPNMLNLRNMSVSIILHGRVVDGKEQATPIFSSTMDVLLKLACFKHAPVRAAWACQNLINTSNASATLFNWLQGDAITTLGVAGTSAGQWSIGFTFHLPSVINLKGSEYIEVSVNSGQFFTTLGTANLSTALFNGAFGQVKGNGIEHGIPQYVVTAIQQNQGQVPVSSNEHTHEIYFINTDKVDFQSTSQVIQSVSHSGKSGGLILSFNELLAHRATQHTSAFWDMIHVQDFLLYEKKFEFDHEDKTLNIVLNTVNVAASTNYVVVCTYQRSHHDTMMHLSNHHDHHLDHLHKVGAVNSQHHAERKGRFNPSKNGL